MPSRWHLASLSRGEVKFRGEWMLVQAMSRQLRPFWCQIHGDMSGAARNRVGTVGTVLETVVETVVKHIETVTSLFQGLNLNT